MAINIIIFVASFFAFGCVCSDPCNKGPAYWCRDFKTATECGVIEYCKGDENGNLYEAKNDYVEKNLAAKPVNISLYYESLCPYCRNFILSQLYPTYLALKSSGIVNIEIYPFGNAYESWNGKKWVFTCQHGQRECELNLIETCALHLLSPAKKLPYIHCVESSPSMFNAKLCAHQLNIEWGPLFKCYNGSEGNYLEHNMARKTNILKPQHKYVPWITSNGVHTDDIQSRVSSNMLAYVCQRYTGVPPYACRRTFKEIDTLKKIEVCYRQ